MRYPSCAREGAYLDQSIIFIVLQSVGLFSLELQPLQYLRRQCLVGGSAMIPIELWRARIGHFNFKRVRSRITSVPVSCSSPISSSASLVGRDPARSTAETPRRLGRPNNAQDCANNSHVSQAPSTVLQTNLGTERETNHQASPWPTTSSILTLSTSLAQSGLLLILNSSAARSLMTMLVIFQLLIMSGDVETNPGPKHGGKEVGVHVLVYIWSRVYQKEYLTPCIAV